jgi:hypothetical protein
LIYQAVKIEAEKLLEMFAAFWYTEIEKWGEVILADGNKQRIELITRMEWEVLWAGN